MGVVTPLGNSLEAMWPRLVAGECGVARITAFDPARFDTQIAAEVKDFTPSGFPQAKDVRRADRFSQFAITAGHQALLDSGLDLAKENLDEIGVFIGSGIGGLRTTQEQHQIMLERGPDRMSPFMIPMLILNMASGIFSMFYNLRGPNVAHCSACATSTHALGEAWRTLKMGDAQVMFAGGSEATIVPLGIGGFCAMKAMSTRNQEPQRASRPFDKERDGFVMGEGSGVFVLEDLDHARARGARIHAELVGYGNSADANHMTAPDPEGGGAARCMSMALRNARLNPGDIQYINAHGTSTPLGDIAETKAVKTVFGDHARKLVISSTKGALGHMLGAAGAVELAVCIKTIQTGIVPPTINLDNPDPECDLDYAPHRAREVKVDAIVNNSFGFGGHNASLVAKRFVG